MRRDGRGRIGRREFNTSLLAALFAPRAMGDPAPHGSARVGINLAGLGDWNTELPFVDVFRLSRPWISQREGARFGEGPALDLDAQGWVRRIEPSCWIETRLCGTDHVPPGEWTVLHDGVGELELWGQPLEQLKSPGQLRFTLAPGAPGGIFLRVLKTDPSNYVRNLRVLMPGHATRFDAEPWNPSFLARWRGMAAVRFMEFQATNNSAQRHWSDRPRLDHATFSGRGMPVELLVDLANRLHSDPWFNLPLLADDDYVRSFATYVKEHLDPALAAHVELSNEVWNRIFTQGRAARAQGRAMRLGSDDFSSGLRFYGQRATEVFKIWKSVLGSQRKLVRVIAAQAANADVARAILGWRDTAEHTDALAIAPYLSFNVDVPRAEEVAGWSLDKLFGALEQELALVSGRLRDHKRVAEQHKLKLMAYEGGQHLVGVLGGENNERTTALFMAANADARMGALYQRYHRAWMEAGGDLFCHFSSVSSWNKWGSWGLLQQYDDAPRRSPKFMAVLRWARECRQPVVVPD